MVSRCARNRPRCVVKRGVTLSQRKTVLIVGSGGREHAIAWKLAQSPLLGALYAAPGNAGIAELATCVPVAVDDVQGQVAFAKRIGADLVVIGPELPLSLGLVDALHAAGIAAIGPTQAAARIESSKQFAKQVMQAAGIPTAAYDVATDVETAEAIIARHFRAGRSAIGDAAPLVIKADGLAAGKGVVICKTEEEARRVATDMLRGHTLSGAGATVVIEQFLTGPELSLLAFSDGERVVPMPFAQDYKRLLTGDKGPNTGGMGSISPVPGCDDRLHAKLVQTCVEPLIHEMARRGTPFQGILFAGLMLTQTGPMVLEYNARFGDPETQALLRRLDGDLLEIFLAMAAGDLSGVRPKWSKEAACCVVMAAKGYPDEPERGIPIEGAPLTRPRHTTGAPAGESFAQAAANVNGDTSFESIVVFHGGTARDERDRLVSDGGRVLSVTAVGPNLSCAVAKAYEAVESIVFPGSQYRTDIGRQ